MARRADGSVVACDVTGPTSTFEIVEVTNGRASVVARADHSPDTILRLDTEAYNALLCGRWNGTDAIAAHRVDIGGDMTLGTAVATSMGYVI